MYLIFVQTSFRSLSDLAKNVALAGSTLLKLEQITTGLFQTSSFLVYTSLVTSWLVQLNGASLAGELL